MVRLAQSYAVPIVYAPPPRHGGVINGATGTVLKVGLEHFILTASHVLDGYEKRQVSGERLNWQVGHLPPFDPLSRIAWRDCARDIVLLRLCGDEASQVGSWVVTPSSWPPERPDVGALVLVAGYPKVLREEIGSLETIGSDPLSAMFRVTTTGEGYFVCQIEQEDLVSFNEGPVPDADTDFGGLSGDPALLVGAIDYPLVGVVSQYEANFQLLRIATLEGVIVDDGQAAEI
jgi:hypothetical protein